MATTITVGTTGSFPNISSALNSLVYPAGDVIISLVSNVTEPGVPIRGNPDELLRLIEVPTDKGITLLTIQVATNPVTINLGERGYSNWPEGMYGGIFANGVPLRIERNITITGSVFGGSYNKDLVGDTNVFFDGRLSAARTNLFGGSYVTGNPNGDDITANIYGNTNLTVGENAFVRGATGGTTVFTSGCSYVNGNYPGTITSIVSGSASVTVYGNVQFLSGGSVFYGINTTPYLVGGVGSVNIDYYGSVPAEQIVGGENMYFVDPYYRGYSHISNIPGDVSVNIYRPAINVCGGSYANNQGLTFEQIGPIDGNVHVSVYSNITNILCGGGYNLVASITNPYMDVSVNGNITIDINSDVTVNNFYGGGYVRCTVNNTSGGRAISNKDITININGSVTGTSFYGGGYVYNIATSTGISRAHVEGNIILNINKNLNFTNIYCGGYSSGSTARINVDGGVRGSTQCILGSSVNLPSSTIFGGGQTLNLAISPVLNTSIIINGTINTVYGGSNISSSASLLSMNHSSITIHGSVNTVYGGCLVSTNSSINISNTSITVSGIVNLLYGASYVQQLAGTSTIESTNINVSGKVLTIYGGGLSENSGKNIVTNNSTINVINGATITTMYGRGNGLGNNINQSLIYLSGDININQGLNLQEGLISIEGNNTTIILSDNTQTPNTLSISDGIYIQDKTILKYLNPQGYVKFYGDIYGPNVGKLILEINNLSNQIAGTLIMTQNLYNSQFTNAQVDGASKGLGLEFNIVIDGTNEGRLIDEPTYNVTYDANTGSGKVPIDPNNYIVDDIVIVLPANDLEKEGYTFIGWSMTPDGSGIIYKPEDFFLMPNQNVILYAIWEANTYSIIAIALQGGSITPSGNIKVQYGKNQLFTFTPDVGYKILNVFIDTVSDPNAVENGEYTFINVQDHHVIEVEFGPIGPTSYEIISTANENGLILPSGTILIEKGNSQLFIFLPNNGYKVFDVLIDGISNPKAVLDGEYKFTNVQENHTIEVFFTQIGPVDFEITSIAYENGIIIPEGTILVEKGGNKLFIFQGFSGYKILNVFIDGESNQQAVIDGQYNFENVQENHIIEVYFEPIGPKNFEIIATASENGIIIPEGIIFVQEGTNELFTFIPDNGYKIFDVLIDNISNQQAILNGKYEFINVQENHTIEVLFEPISPSNFEIIATASENGVIIPEGTVLVEKGENLLFVFIPDSGYKILDVLIDGISNPKAVSSGQYIFENIQENHTIEVLFAPINTSFFIINTQVCGCGFVAPSDIVAVEEGSSQTIIFVPYDGYMIYNVVIDGVYIPTSITSGQYTFKNIHSNHNVCVTFISKSKFYKIINKC